MASFGEELRALRKRQGLARQQDLADALNGAISRSTVGGLETGGQAPSLRVWLAISERFPDEVEHLRSAYELARAEQEEADLERRLNRQADKPATAPTIKPTPDYVLERYEVIYIFGESRSPEEIIEIRRVRALTAGAHDFGLLFSRDGGGFEVTMQVLFGGEVTGFDLQEPDGATVIMHLLDFQRSLRKGQRHSFGVRYLIERNPSVGHIDHVQLDSDYETEEVGLSINFWGTTKPRSYWAYEGLPHAAMAPGTPQDGVVLDPNRHSMVSAEFKKPVSGTYFGIGWAW